MQHSFGALTMSVINTACVMMVIAYVVIRTRTSLDMLEKTTRKTDMAILTVLFGFFSIYSGINAIPVNIGVVSLRHSGPIIGGLIGGPVVGLGAGLIGAADRLLQDGMIGSWKSATLALIMAGFFSGLYSQYRQHGNIVSVKNAVFFTAAYEVFAAGLTFVFAPSFDAAFALEKQVRIPLIIGNMVAVAIFFLFVQNMIEERRNKNIKEQIEHELTVARTIQMSMVPKVFPVPPDVPEIEVFASLESAKEVGGDLYDFFYIDDNHFCFVIGDVSGKGVPASLFMAVTKTLIQAKAGVGISAADILYHTNNELCRGNDESMFVTLFCGILDIRTGEVEFCNAGHNKPYLHRTDGNCQALNPQKGIALGIMEEFPFTNENILLAPGDAIVIYTDGVTEAMDNNNQMFSEERLENCIAEVGNAAAKEITQSIVSRVKDFVDGAPQSDDITILALRYFGGAQNVDKA
jgi:sigma-B regulation protein RsbU (phosphoserine phosphatase)